MARKDLTALAALGTLGYMLSKKGDKVDASAAERRIAADKEASAEPQSMENDSGMDSEEAANKRVERTLTNPNAKEFGEAGTSMTVSPTKKPTMRRPVVKSRPVSPAMDAAMQEANASPITRATYDAGMNRSDANRSYKKGGKVKKMASGGMTASKRADGIATRGKTKCKMY